MTVPNRCVGPAGLGCTVSPRYWPWLLGDQLCDSGQVTGCPVFSVKPVAGGGSSGGGRWWLGGSQGSQGGCPGQPLAFPAHAGSSQEIRQLPSLPQTGLWAPYAWAFLLQTPTI